MNNEIHECEYKKGKMWDIEESQDGTFCCARCRKEISKEHIHPEALRTRRNHGRY